MTRIYNCFNVFSKSKAFHGKILQEKSFTITFFKPCRPKLFVNLQTFFFSAPKLYNGFKVKHSPVKAEVDIMYTKSLWSAMVAWGCILPRELRKTQGMLLAQ